MNDFKAYIKVGKEYNRKRNEYQAFKKRNPKEKVTEDEWIISTLITDLLVAKGELDSSYIDRYNY